MWYKIKKLIYPIFNYPQDFLFYTTANKHSLNNNMSRRNMVTKALAEEVKVALDNDMTDDQVQKVCETFMQVIYNKVEKGEEVTLTNFVKFARVLNKERTFSIPNSDEKTTKPARYGLKVKIMAGVKTAFEAIPIEQGASDNDSEPKSKGKAKAKAKESDSEIKPEPKPKGKGKAKAAKEESDSEIQSVSDSEPKSKGKGTANAKGKAKGKAKAKDTSSEIQPVSDDSDDSDSEIQPEPKGKGKGKGKAATKKKEEENEFMFSDDD